MKIVEKKSIIKLVTVAIKCDVCSKISNISDISSFPQVDLSRRPLSPGHVSPFKRRPPPSPPSINKIF